MGLVNTLGPRPREDTLGGSLDPDPLQVTIAPHKPGSGVLSQGLDNLALVRSADTSSDIRRRQIDVYRSMGPERRIDLALTMSEEVRRVTLDGIRSRNPAFDDARVNAELLQILHGVQLASIIAASHPTH